MLLTDKNNKQIEVRQEIIDFAIEMELAMKAKDPIKSDSWKRMGIEELAELKFNADGLVEDEIIVESINFSALNRHLINQSNYNMMLFNRSNEKGLK